MRRVDGWYLCGPENFDCALATPGHCNLNERTPLFMYFLNAMSDELLSWLLECFPEVDFEILAHAARVNHTREDAIDFILASQASPGSC